MRRGTSQLGFVLRYRKEMGGGVCDTTGTGLPCVSLGDTEYMFGNSCAIRSIVGSGWNRPSRRMRRGATENRRGGLKMTHLVPPAAQVTSEAVQGDA